MLCFSTVLCPQVGLVLVYVYISLGLLLPSDHISWRVLLSDISFIWEIWSYVFFFSEKTWENYKRRPTLIRDYLLNIYNALSSGGGTTPAIVPRTDRPGALIYEGNGHNELLEKSSVSVCAWLSSVSTLPSVKSLVDAENYGGSRGGGSSDCWGGSAASGINQSARSSRRGSVPDEIELSGLSPDSSVDDFMRPPPPSVRIRSGRSCPRKQRFVEQNILCEDTTVPSGTTVLGRRSMSSRYGTIVLICDEWISGFGVWTA